MAHRPPSPRLIDSRAGNWMLGGWGRVTLDVQLSDAIPWEVDLKTGALRGTLDLSTGKLARLDCDSGSTKIDLSLPPPAGQVPIRIEGGSVRVRQRGFGSVTWQTPGADPSIDRYEARFSGGSVVADVEQG